MTERILFYSKIKFFFFFFFSLSSEAKQERTRNYSRPFSLSRIHPSLSLSPPPHPVPAPHFPPAPFSYFSWDFELLITGNWKIHFRFRLSFEYFYVRQWLFKLFLIFYQFKFFIYEFALIFLLKAKESICQYF